MFKIACISDVDTTCGSPQIPALLNYIIDYYPNSKGLLIEPEKLDNVKVNIRKENETFDREKIFTFENPHSVLGEIEYILKVQRAIESFRPDILIICVTYNLPVLFKINFRPKLVIYYNLEMPDRYGELQQYLNKNIKDKVDLLLFPEENRKDIFYRKYGNTSIPSEVIFNCVNEESVGISEMQKVARSMIYQGTVNTQLTFARYFLNESIQKFNIDIFGEISGRDKDNLFNSLNKLKGNVVYRGAVESEYLKKIRRNYFFGIVAWNPISDNYFYAAPNKLFEYISSGIIPISTPHPQCKYVIEKYSCGIIAKGWDFHDFYEALEAANSISGTEEYSKMVSNCGQAVKEEFNWNNQMKKIDKYLDSIKLK